MYRVLALAMMLAAMVAGAADVAASATVVTVGEYRLTLTGDWQLPPADNTDKTLLAVRVKDGKTVGLLMAAPLAGTVKDEANEMVASAREQTGAVKILGYDEFVTTAGVSGRRVELGLRIEHPILGGPIIFESIYLPQADGTSVTLKRMSTVEHSNLIGPEFRALVRASVATPAAPAAPAAP